MKIDPYVSSSTKLKSKRIKEHNIKSDILNLIEEKMGEKPLTHEHRGKFPEQNTNSLCSKIINK